MASPDAVSIARELGVCEPGKPGSLALLGPGDHAAPYHSGCAKTGHHKANRLAYFSFQVRLEGNRFGGGEIIRFGSAFFRETAEIILTTEGAKPNAAQVSGIGIIN